MSREKLKIMALLLSVVFLIQLCSGKLGFGLGVGYYAIFAIILFILSIYSKKIRINYNITILVLICFLSIYFNTIPSFFNSKQRLFAFCLIIVTVSPWISNPNFIRFRYKLFYYINIVNSLVVFFSFIFFLFGLGFLVTGRGGFTGFYSHSMLMGPFSALSFLWGLYLFHSANRKNIKIISILVLISSFACCILAGSRGALLALIVGCLLFFWKRYNNSFRKFTSKIILGSALLIFSFPIWKTYTNRIVEKFEYANEKSSFTVTRDFLWRARIDEFIDNPILGIGFSSVDILSTSKFDEESGVVETGSSWLTILSMTGIFGFITMLILVLRILIFLFKSQNHRLDLNYLFGVFTFFIIHLFLEGYVFSAGSTLFLMFWLIIGLIFPHINSTKN